MKTAVGRTENEDCGFFQPPRALTAPRYCCYAKNGIKTRMFLAREDPLELPAFIRFGARALLNALCDR